MVLAVVAAAAAPVAAVVAVFSLVPAVDGSGALASDRGPAPSVVEKTLAGVTTFRMRWSAERGGGQAVDDSSCAAIGDSLAVGSAAALRATGIGCSVSARVGASSAEILASMPARVEASSVILSAGVNDGSSPTTAANLLAIRSRLPAEGVVWLVPKRSPARQIVEWACARSGDRAVDLAPFIGPDGLHPANLAGYGSVVAARSRAVPCTGMRV